MLRLLLALLLVPAARAQPWFEQAQADVDTLTSDAFAGRGYGNGGAERAAGYLSRRMAAIGLEPVLGDSFAVPFAFETDLVDGALLIAGGDTLGIGYDAVPYAGSSGAASGPVVDVGDATAALVDPAGMQARVAGRIALVSADVPASAREMLPEGIAVPGARATMLARMGAAGVIVLGEAPTFGPAAFDVPVPVGVVRRGAWPEGAEHAQIVVQTRINAAVTGLNVIGRARGSGARAPLLVLAHYDALGTLTDLSDSTRVVFRGANDNASGTALLLALAQAARADSLERDVLFAAVGAEEQGLIGAHALRQALAGQPLAAVLNFDMVASGETGLLAFGGTDHPDLFARAERLADSLGAGPLVPRANRANSDHYPFLAAGTPGLYLLTAGGTQPYHSPDDVAETLEWNDWAAVYQLARALMRDLAGTEVVQAEAEMR